MRISLSDQLQALHPDHIIRVEAASNYSKVYFVDRRLAMVLAASLIRVEEILPASSFVRVHRSHLINKAFIRKIHGGEHKVVELINGETIAISRRKKKLVKREAVPLQNKPMNQPPKEAAIG